MGNNAIAADTEVSALDQFVGILTHQQFPFWISTMGIPFIFVVLAIIAKHAKGLGLELPPEVLLFWASFDLSGLAAGAPAALMISEPFKANFPTLLSLLFALEFVAWFWMMQSESKHLSLGKNTNPGRGDKSPAKRVLNVATGWLAILFTTVLHAFIFFYERSAA